MMYHCKQCGREEDYDLSPFDLKIALNPHLAIKETWDAADWDAPIGLCECGGEIEIGSLPTRGVTICFSEEERVSVAMGVRVEDIEKAERKWPGSKYRKRDGALLYKGRSEKLRRLKQRGFCEY